MIYFLDDVSDNDDGDIYKVAVTDGQVKKPEMFDSDVSNRAIFFTANDKLAYYKNVNYSDNKGDLYIGGDNYGW